MHILPLPEVRAPLGFEEPATTEEIECIKRGVVPQEMEDKWFVFYEDAWLYLHRSWTGACIYGVRFQPAGAGASAVESWVSRDTKHYKETRIDYDRAMLKFLIDAFLLGSTLLFQSPTTCQRVCPLVFTSTI